MKYSHQNPPATPVDYLAIGHISQDITPDGLQIGGTVSFSGLTALAFGLRVGIVTAIPDNFELAPLAGIDIASVRTSEVSTFENIQTPLGRVQVLHAKGSDLSFNDVPPAWRNAPIVHLAPICREIDPAAAAQFPDSFLGVTPQGWMRTWDESGRVVYGGWQDSDPILNSASAVILSIEDVHHDENRIEELIPKTPILVVTEGASGARVFWNGDVRFIKAPEVDLVEPTGAGDIFAASFFIRLAQTRDPWESARVAVRIASTSVTRVRLAGVPEPAEIKSALIEIITDGTR